jgi:hypothetical protein
MLIQPVEIFKKSWHVFKDNWQVLLKITGWLMIPAVLLGILGMVDQKMGASFIAESVPIYLGLTALSFILGLWVSIVLVRLISHALEQQPVNFSQLKTEAWRDTVPYLWVMVLVNFFVLLGLVLFIVPGILMAIWFSFASYIFILEGTRGMAAIRQSKALVKGKFWAVVWRFFVPNFIFGLFMVVLIGVPYLLYRAFAPGLDWQTQPWWLNLWQSIITIAGMPLTVGFAIILYKSLKENKQ